MASVPRDADPARLMGSVPRDAGPARLMANMPRGVGPARLMASMPRSRRGPRALDGQHASRRGHQSPSSRTRTHVLRTYVRATPSLIHTENSRARNPVLAHNVRPSLIRTHVLARLTKPSSVPAHRLALVRHPCGKGGASSPYPELATSLPFLQPQASQRDVTARLLAPT